MLFLVFAWAARTETLVAANLCDMVERQDQFKSKLVSVRAEVVVGFEIQAVVDGSCPNQRVWFELDEAKQDTEYKRVERAWKDLDLRKKITATLIGHFEAGPCFGHQCYSHTQLRILQFQNVTVGERRLAPDFSAHDCSLLIRETQVPFQKGHMDNVLDKPAFMKALEVVLTDPAGATLVSEASPIFQIALTNTRMKVIVPKRGVFRLSGLYPGAYVFSALAPGFQSVTGCFVISPNATRTKPLRIELPLGV